jgi:hypothetical protein
MVIAVGGCLSAHSQTLTKIKSEVISNVRPDQSQSNIFDTVLFRADATLRFGDVYTSHRLFHDPCNCFYEANPISPSSTTGIILFQYSALMGIQATHNQLVKRGHPKLARLAYVLDIVSESYAVGHNAYLMTDPHRSK